MPRSSISRQAIEGSAEQLRQLQERRWDQSDLLAIYIDGQRFGTHHVLSALGMDRGGSKQILGIELGARGGENSSYTLAGTGSAYGSPISVRH